MDVTLFQFTISTNRVDYIVTNDKIQKTSQTVQDVYRALGDCRNANN